MPHSPINRRLALAALASLLPGAVLAQSSANSKLVDVTLVSSTANPPSVSNIYYLAALDRTFQKHGLNVHLQQSSGSPSSLAAIVSGKAEFASINLVTLANAAAEGIKARIIATGNFDFPGIIYAQPGINSVKDLEGKKMGAAAIGSMDYTIPQAYLMHVGGVDFSKISWVATRQTSVTLQALGAGQIDAAWINVSSAVSVPTIAPKIKVLVSAEDISKIAPNPGGTVVVTDKYASEHPDVVQNFVDAVIEGNRAMYQDEGFFDSVVEHWMPGIYTDDQKKFLYTAYRPSWGVNGGLVMRVMRSAVESWKTDINPDRAKNPYFSKAEDLVNTQFAAKTLGQIGKFDGALDDADWQTK
ncbi:MAG TPA: ABC transporter substrate-binding protein [Beijerinckiaceae bacterium]|jgi:ABC-type nitrate/sulfonate/bicarbonate transport system substrate-binding protein|nr:ABC transporter substrate-binding protein [Beijerinckiaceae bacterium]